MDAYINDPAFWVAIAFFIAIGIAWKPASKMIVGGLDARSQKIADELDHARQLREEAQELLASYERKQREAEKEAEGIVAHAREEAERLSRRAAEELEHQVSRRRQLALDRIGQAESDAVREVRSAAVELALKATRKLLDDKIGEAEQAKLVEDAISEIGKRLH
ncbi:MAG: F0F1 ATP synthase subunit B [Alphaproteobacteria bacterium]|jgi:F-type H+-transporting ATPase subunit b|nr:F0F1 ATP synthase subunit B [Rhodospirillaceae bacterium]MDG2480218.1 F0F1 ATP synthase subunit B [Alphaproteobacteria bacterium]MBT6204859.1 F0F1 ATP synthase subunit B [Rhodospirillaceae bacterium]MBT6511136.1 F0F1 ATP synthase subunit B [Rhodospirillaceae bacterium]MBT7613911.1 F0F1 ATP synthase subunit B [Rhodospirillaceae bacterium]